MCFPRIQGAVRGWRDSQLPRLHSGGLVAAPIHCRRSEGLKPVERRVGTSSYLCLTICTVRRDSDRVQRFQQRHRRVPRQVVEEQQQSLVRQASQRLRRTLVGPGQGLRRCGRRGVARDRSGRPGRSESERQHLPHQPGRPVFARQDALQGPSRLLVLGGPAQGRRLRLLHADHADRARDRRGALTDSTKIGWRPTGAPSSTRQPDPPSSRPSRPLQVQAGKRRESTTRRCRAVSSRPTSSRKGSSAIQRCGQVRTCHTPSPSARGG